MTEFTNCLLISVLVIRIYLNYHKIFSMSVSLIYSAAL